MAESIPNSGVVNETWAPYERIKRVESLVGSDGGQWILKKIADLQSTYERLATAPAKTEEERLVRQVHADQLEVIRVIARFVVEEKDSAMKLLNDMEKKASPPHKPKKEPEL